MYLFEISFIIGVLGLSALSFTIGQLEGYSKGLKKAEEIQREQSN